MTPLDKLFADCTVALLRENNIEPYVGTELTNITDLDNLVIDTVKAKQAIKDLMLELIGEDIPQPSLGNFWDVGRNQLRSELRQKVSDL